MQIARSSLFHFREARRQARYTRDRQGKRGQAGALLCSLCAVANAAWRNRYGMLRFDVLIAGPDRLLNLLLAHKAVTRGQSFAIYHGPSGAECWQEAEDVERLRLSIYEPAFTEMIESLLGLNERGMPEGVFREESLINIADPVKQYEELLKELGFQIDRHWNMAHSYLLSGCQLDEDLLENTQKGRRYRVNAAEPSVGYPAIDNLVFWPERFPELESRDIDRRQFAIEVNEVWWTGNPSTLKVHKDEGSVIDRYYGEAKWPLSTFSQFVSNDRMRDILHAIRED